MTARSLTLNALIVLIPTALGIWSGYVWGSIDTAHEWSSVTTRSANLADRCIAHLESALIIARNR